jgi:pimeloyl-ACP methyl ester carboxylesterase
MPKARIDDSLTMHYELDNFAEPWRAPETVMLVHGIGGSSAEWFAWVPPLAGRYAVLRVDLRGWGQSTIPPADYAWSMDNYAADLRLLMDRLGIGKVHMVGTKLGGRIAMHFAHAHPGRLHSLTLVCTPMNIRDQVADDSRDRRPTVEGGAESVAHWARSTMRERLGDVSPEMMEWWTRLYAQSSPQVIGGVYDLAWWTDEYALLPHIHTPTLVIDSSAIVPIAQTRKWQALLPDSEMADIPVTTEGRQISASKPAECVAVLLDFLERLSARTNAANAAKAREKRAAARS